MENAITRITCVKQEAGRRKKFMLSSDINVGHCYLKANIKQTTVKKRNLKEFGVKDILLTE